MVTEKELRERAREMRRNPTEWEVRIWRHLSNRQLAGKFRRQHVIFPHICDFFCPSKGLIIELDGDTHDAVEDSKRDKRLARKGFLTIRFTNTEVRENIDGVLAAIVSQLEVRPDRWSGVPHPNPSPEGEGLEIGAPEKPLPIRGGVGVGATGDTSQRTP